MPKEITLEELAASSKGNDPKPATPKVKVPESPSNGAKKFSPSEVADTLTKAGVMEKKEEVITETPLVENAFASMNKTLQEKKDWINNVMMPIVEENAREMALEAEFGTDVLEETDKTEEFINDVTTNNDTDDIFKELEDDEDTDDGITKPEDLFGDLDDDDDPYTGPAQEYEHNKKIEEQAERTYKFDQPEESNNKEPIKDEPKKEEKKSDKESRLVVNEDFIDSDQGSLDELMKDLDLEDSMNIVDDEDETPEEIREKFKETLKDMKITSDPIDFNKFKIRKQAVNSNFVLSTLKNNRTVKKADWALYHTKKSVTFLECSGPE